MTISQRLTRAGLTFIILGTVAALLPQHDAARATTDCQTCTKATTNYWLTGNSNGCLTYFTFTKCSSPVTLYGFSSTGNGPASKASASYTYTSSTLAKKAFTSPGYSTTGTPTSNSLVKAEFAATGKPTYTVQYPVFVF